MKRGFVLLSLGVVTILWFVAPASAARWAQPSPTTVAPAAAPTTVAPATAAPTTIGQAASALPDDPAAKRLRLVVYGLLGLGGVILVGTVVFWKVTRPPLLLPPSESTPARGAGAATSAASGGVTAPAKIPAAVVLATPAGSSLPTMAAVAATAVATISTAPATTADPADTPPPEGSPAIDAPPPLDDIPLGAQKPLVGPDSAWIIEPESSSGLIAATPSAVDFPEPSEPVEDPPEAELPEETRALISALSAIPDQEPTVVRFDDPPVERVVQARPRPQSSQSVPQKAAQKAAQKTPQGTPQGAPGFDKIAKDTKEARRIVDDMALMASALSSLPARDEPAVDVPPVGDFYDQDLDPGDPPGR